MLSVLLSKISIYNNDFKCVMEGYPNEIDAYMHYHDFFEIIIFLGSSGAYQTKDKLHTISRGDIIFIPMFEPHTIFCYDEKQNTQLDICIEPGILPLFSTADSCLLDIFSKKNKNYPIFHSDEQSLQKNISLVHEYMQTTVHACGQDLFQQAFLYQLLARLYSVCHDGPHTQEMTLRHTAVAARLMAFIHSHLAEELSLERLANEVHYSIYYICRLFKLITGFTLINYIVTKRIERTVHLLHSGMSIPDAAKVTGFNNYSYFYKAFRKVYGISPAEYRDRIIRRG